MLMTTIKENATERDSSRLSVPATRREMLRRCSLGFGVTALSGLLAESARAAASAGSSAGAIGHLPQRAKSVIFCFMSGGVSHVDSFDPKPRLARDAGKPLPLRIERTQFNRNGNILPSPWKFHRYGESGIPVSDLFRHTASCVDDLAVIRSMTSQFSEHAQGNYFVHTGFPFLGHPSAGAWVTYGLGSESRNLPGFVVLRSGGSGIPHGGVGLFGSGFLPATHQGSILDASADEALRNVRPREGDVAQRRRLGLIARNDRRFLRRVDDNPHVEAAIENYEMAYRMQAAVPELVDLSGESEATKRLYGVDSPDKGKAGYARQCLLARRLVERGVRFVELTCLSYNIGGGNSANPWDQHGQLKKGHERMAFQVDQPIAALIKDLKSRGLLDETLVIWAGEFGRTPFSQDTDGRDHDPFGFSIWLAGGGVRGGTIYGATDEFGYRAVESPCTIYDLWATVLHLLGQNHFDLTYRHGGRDFRLTDVHGRVLSEVLV